MTLFTIDNEKCNKDGICALECPAHIIEMTENGPVPSDGAEEICIRCGHCVAVCPRAAITLNFLSPEECMPVKKELAMDAPQLVFTHASNEFGSAAADCHTALAYLELALPGFGLGSCWAGYVNYAAGQWPALAEFLSFPENHSCHGALMIGFPKFKYFRAPKRNNPVVRYHETFSRQMSEAEKVFENIWKRFEK